MRYLLLPLTRRYVTFASALVATILLLLLSFSDPLLLVSLWPRFYARGAGHA